MLTKLSQKTVREISELVDNHDVAKSGARCVPVKIREKERIFTVPNSYLKNFLRDLLGLLGSVTLPPYVFSQKGLSFINKVYFHKNDPCLVNMDIKNYFPSVNSMRIAHFYRSSGFDELVSEKITRLTTFKESLPLGFPTSPILANLVFSKVDTRLFSWARSRGLKYSRYVDDLTFSGKRLNETMLETPISIIESNHWEVNRNKTSPVYRKDDVKCLMGLSVIRGKISITDKYRKTVLVDIEAYKKLINNGVDENTADELLVLKGKLNFIKQVDPESYKTLLSRLI